MQPALFVFKQKHVAPLEPVSIIVVLSINTILLRRKRSSRLYLGLSYTVSITNNQ